MKIKIDIPDKLKIGIVIGFSLFLYFVLIVFGNFKNNVVFTGDEWEYQAMAVNQYYGHGFMVTGKLENTSKYKIVDLDDGKMDFWQQATGKAFHRSPFYPFFLRICYSVFGVNPIYVKIIQLVLIFVAGLLLVKISILLWGNNGFLPGMIVFGAFVLMNFKFAEHLMPENWQLLFISLISLLLFYRMHGEWVYSLLFGCVLALSLLNKGTTFFLLPIIILYDLINGLKNKYRDYKNTIVLLTAYIVITGSWSLYVSGQVGDLVFVTTQAEDVLIDGNNELCNDGLWHPQWRNNENSFYNQKGVNEKSTLAKLFLFYSNKPLYLNNFLQKISTGFLSLISINILLITIFTYLVIIIFYKKQFLSTYRAKWIIHIIAFGAIAACYYIVYQIDKKLLAITFLFLCLIPAIQFFRKKGNALILPFPLLAIIYNFLVFTLIFYSCNEVYTSRYIKTMEGITLLSILFFFDKIAHHLFDYNMLHNNKLQRYEKK